MKPRLGPPEALLRLELPEQRVHLPWTPHRVPVGWQAGLPDAWLGRQVLINRVEALCDQGHLGIVVSPPYRLAGAAPRYQVALFDPDRGGARLLDWGSFYPLSDLIGVADGADDELTEAGASTPPCC